MSIIKSSILISFLSLIISVISFFSQLLIAKYFGASKSMDFYLYSTSIPLLFSAIITSSLSYSFTPFLIRIRVEANQNYQQFLGYLYLKSIISSIILFTLLFGILVLVGYKEVSVNYNYSLDYFIGIVFFSCLTAIVNIQNSILICIYNSQKSFILPTIFSIFPYILTIVFVILFHNKWSSFSIVIGLFIGSLITLIFSHLFLNQKVSFSKLSSINPIEINSYLKKLPAIAIAMLCFTVYQSIDSFWAPRLGFSNFSYLSYCQRIIIAFGTLVIVGPSTVLIPRLTLSIAEGRKNDFLNDTVAVLKIIIALSSLLAVICSLLSKNIVELLFERGEFSPIDTLGVASILPFMLFGMVFMITVVMLFRSFFASNTNNYVVILGISATLFYFIFSGIGSYFFGLKGIAISYLASWILIFLISLLLIFKNDFRLILNKQTIKFFLNQLLLLAIVFISVYVIKVLFDFYIDNNFKLKSFLILIISGAIGVLTYLIFSTKIIKQVEIIVFLNKIGIK